MNFDYKRMFKFEHNVGGKEKQYRLYGGVALFVLSIFTGSVLFLVVGCILIATGFFGFCPLNAGFQRNSCSAADGEAPG